MRDVNFVFCLVCSVIVVICDTVTHRRNELARILEYENVITDPRGAYRFSYRASDGSWRVEVGEIKNSVNEKEFLVVTGKYGYTDTNGNAIEYRYAADENGYRSRRDTPPLVNILTERSTFRTVGTIPARGLTKTTPAANALLDKEETKATKTTNQPIISTTEASSNSNSTEVGLEEFVDYLGLSHHLGSLIGGGLIKPTKPPKHDQT